MSKDLNILHSKGRKNLTLNTQARFFLHVMLGLHYTSQVQHEILNGSMRYHLSVFLSCFHSSYYFPCYHSLCVWINVN